jgi:hypothetical protein
MIRKSSRHRRRRSRKRSRRRRSRKRSRRRRSPVKFRSNSSFYCVGDKLVNNECCCGATKNVPCECMKRGIKCSRRSPKCPCFKLLDKQIKASK